MKHIHHDLMVQYAKDTSIKPVSVLRPFNLKEALAGMRVVTYEGDEVTQLVQFKTKRNPDYIHGVVAGVVNSWGVDGYYDLDSEYHRLYMQELN
tara:strand:- start:378 stop:659 length:282 start_codon:yes stop_codon:yes gene_type:complete